MRVVFYSEFLEQIEEFAEFKSKIAGAWVPERKVLGCHFGILNSVCRTYSWCHWDLFGSILPASVPIFLTAVLTANWTERWLCLLRKPSLNLNLRWQSIQIFIVFFQKFMPSFLLFARKCIFQLISMCCAHVYTYYVPVCMQTCVHILWKLTLEIHWPEWVCKSC